jgi:hypothetical protein
VVRAKDMYNPHVNSSPNFANITQLEI